MKEYKSKTQSETEKIAQAVVKKLQGGEVLALVGNLGAGKTVFVKGLAKALGIEDNITSPTFVLMKIYQTSHATIKRLVHVDCYRLEKVDDLDDIGLADYLHDPASIVVIEWADRVVNLPKNTININIEYINSQERIVKVS
ncbi:MAG: tRNA threonylcarbamoyladenosine biosynthesis protein TsaE [Patescibacteria group bacterium]|jgi:tRNA threonylcarbamoyladenosine biosynthesis protein TsaE|nr:tRNA threonylcarbamoyladenosine biosynthesis protein TsaE [Patescibacteria group bacterium]MDQ5970863.1 tRNA threonylcarbamoyladenosine biosynthesis protein TsaE [Patescibacteria group bacterium]